MNETSHNLINGHEWVKHNYVWKCSKCGEITHYMNPYPEMKLIGYKSTTYLDHGDEFKSRDQVFLTCEEFVVLKALNE